MVTAPVPFLASSDNTKNQRWFMEFKDAPETLLHDVIIELLKLVLKHRFHHQTGGPFPLQIWRKTHNPTTMRCTHAGPTPGYSPALGAWAIITVNGHLRIADDANGDQIWLTRAKAAEEEVSRLRALLEDQTSSNQS